MLKKIISCIYGRIHPPGHKHSHPMLIVSLSTIPARFKLLGPTLNSIIKQDIKIDSIEVNVPKVYRRFPEWDQVLPEVPPGIKIHVVDNDLGPATKILPTTQRYKNQDALIIYCDDDRICPPNWARSFIEAHQQRPDSAIASCGWEVSNLGMNYQPELHPRAQILRSRNDIPYRWRRIKQKFMELQQGRKLPKPRRTRNFRTSGYIDIMEGYGGVLVQPYMFDQEAFNIPDKLWTVDDIWLSGVLARQGIGIWANGHGVIPEEQFDIEDALCQSVIDGMNREQANLACAQFIQENYGVWT